MRCLSARPAPASLQGQDLDGLLSPHLNQPTNVDGQVPVTVQLQLDTGWRCAGRTGTFPIAAECLRGEHDVTVAQVNVEGWSCGVRRHISCLLYTSPSPRDGLL